ncbi:MAG: MarR family winged helix-turn-helix transcriptional regulator [Desulfosarcinaceae bacterium]|jgi:DNA-binding MarR family transcriptional regulator
MNKKQTTRVAQRFADDCIAYRVRTLNRVITKLYDTVLKPFGITVNQTTILAMLTLVKKARPGEIGKKLHMERSTVSRNLERMRKNGWIEMAPGESGTARLVSVTPKGRKLLAALHPQWEKAQTAAARLLGDNGVNAVQTLHEAVQQTNRPS